AALTDTVDGLVARLQRRITALGQFLDPLADKLLISAALVALVNIDLLAPWVAMTIIIREVLVSLLRVYASARGKAIPASFFGKLKTVAQIAAVVALILDPSLFVLGKSLAWVIMAVAVVLTIFSGGEFLVALPRTLRSPTKAHS
ncbi:MAG: CDP-diacylglycerol--glycerol-3-phosphate 3-phosphatidyltransferase, partial [Terriglobia bacterium]